MRQFRMLLEFLESGQLRGVRIGACQSEMRDLLGPPSAVAAPGSVLRGSDVWRYGAVEIGFWRSGVWYYALQFGMKRNVVVPLLSVEALRFDSQATATELVQYLDRKRVCWTPIKFAESAGTQVSSRWLRVKGAQEAARSGSGARRSTKLSIFLINGT